MTDWKWIVTHQPRKQWNRVLNLFTDYNSLSKKVEDGLTIYYFRNLNFPTVDEFIKTGTETFDVALSLKGDVAVDIGSHVGAYALRLARSFRQVYAFEPNPITYQVLLKNIKANSIANVKAEQAAVSENPGTSTMRVPDKFLAGTTIAPDHYDWLKFTRAVQVRTESLDNYFLKHHGRVGFVKIDAENHELAVLKGMRWLIREHRPVMSVEVHHRPDTLHSCNCNVCEWLRREGLSVSLHGRYTPEMEAHWVIAR